MLSFSQTRTPRPFADVLRNLGERKPVASHSSQRLGQWFARKVAERRDVSAAITKFARSEFGCDLEVPKTPLITADIASGRHGRPLDVLEAQLLEYDQAFDVALRKCPFFGTVKYTGAHECVFTYCDAKKSVGLMQMTHHIRGHEHHLVNVRERKLSDTELVLPAKQRRIVAHLPDDLLRQMRVITGMLVLQTEQEAVVVHRDHVVGKKLREIGAAARRYGPQALRGAAVGTVAAGGLMSAVAVVSAIGTAIAAALPVAVPALVTGAVVVAAADPALVIGDVVLSGWLEIQE